MHGPVLKIGKDRDEKDLERDKKIIFEGFL